MWIVPTPVKRNPKKETVHASNEFFRLIEVKPKRAISLPISLPVVGNRNTTPEVLNPATSAPFRYRIILSYTEDLMVAGSDVLDEITQYWRYIERELIPKTAAIREHKDEVFQFYKVRLTAKAVQNQGTVSPADRRGSTTELPLIPGTSDTAGAQTPSITIDIGKSPSDKKRLMLESLGLPNEKLVGDFACALWRKLPRQGTMYITENYVCFSSFMMKHPVIIPFNLITSITKESTKLGMLQDSIKIKKKDEEYFFANFFHRNEAYQMLEQLWNLAMEKLLKTAEKNSNQANIHTPGEKASAQEVLATHTRKVKFNSIFRISPDEKLMEEFSCFMALPDGSNLKGTLYVSKNFICYHSRLGRELYLGLSIDPARLAREREQGRDPYLETTQVVIPMRLVRGIVQLDRLEENAPPGLQFELEQGRSYMFYLKKRAECYDLVSGLWRAMSAITNDDLINLDDSDGESDEAEAARYVDTSKAMVASDLGKPESPSSGVLGYAKPKFGFDAKLRDNRDPAVRVAREQWEAYFAQYGRGPAMMKTAALKSLLETYGIPDELRGELWFILSGAVYKLEVHKDYYRRILKAHHGKESIATEEIERDLHRTFPEHPYYQTDEGIASLRRVLTAYSWRNPEIGYCQSMNIICALLLLYMPEEHAFWTLCAVCEDFLPEYYKRTMIGSIVDEKILEWLLATHMPQLKEHLDKIRAPIDLISQPWLLCMFIGYIEMAAALRTLDVFWLEGASVFQKVALAIYKVNEKALMAAEDDQEAIMLLKEPHNDARTLIEAAFSPNSPWSSLPLSRLAELRSNQKFAAIKTMEANNKRSVIRVLSEHSKFDTADLEVLYSQFNSLVSPSSPNLAEIDRQGFTELFNKYVPFWRPMTYIPDIAFQMFDKDKDGFLSLVEFVEGLSTILRGEFDERFALCFKLHDFDNDGQLDKDNFYAATECFLASYAVPRTDLSRFVSAVFQRILHKRNDTLLATIPAEAPAGDGYHPKVSWAEVQKYVLATKDLFTQYFQWNGMAFMVTSKQSHHSAAAAPATAATSPAGAVVSMAPQQPPPPAGAANAVLVVVPAQGSTTTATTTAAAPPTESLI